MAKSNTKKTIKIKWGRIMLLVGFMFWTVMSGIFLYKVTGPSINMYLLQDNYVYSMEYGNPYNREGADEAYEQYNGYVNSLINGDDAIVSTYVQQNALVKVIMYVSALVPFGTIIAFIYNAYKEEKDSKKSKRTYRVIYNH